VPEYSALGKRPPRVDAVDKVTGRALYSADITLPNMLHGKVLRSPHAHARIMRLDTTRVRAMEGVMAVVTAADVPGLQESGEVLAPLFPCLAKEKVVYAGQPVAALAAVNPHLAEEALGLIEVEYEILTPVLDVLEAMKPNAPLVYPSLCTQNMPGKEGTPSNIFWYMNYLRGDVDAGFRKADIVLENTFRTQTVHQGHLEPRAAVADVAPDGKITVWTDNQGIFKVRELVSAFLKAPLNHIKVMPVEVGGAFGGKEHQQLSPLCALLAQKSGWPVRMVMTREEVFKATRPAPATVITIRLGATKDGYLTAAWAEMIYDYGTSTGMPGLGEVHFGVHALSPYRIPNFKVEYYDVLTNKAPSGPYRAPSATQAAFAMESQMDLLARELGMEPLELRLKNAVAEGDFRADGVPYSAIGFKETLGKMAQYLAQRGKIQGKNRGRGIAAGLWTTHCMGSAAHINVNTDGSVVLVVGSTDVSGTRTSFAQMVAEEFGIPLTDVTVVIGDTETAPLSCISAGSMTTRSTGKAVYRACQDVKEQLCRRAARELKVDPNDVEFGHARVQVKGMAAKYISLADLVRGDFAMPNTGPVTGSGVGELLGEQTPVFAVQVADVEVDEETGKVTVLSYTAAQDAGLAINPTIVEGQMQGAVAQGIGWALSENYMFREGVMENPTFLDYRMPIAPDLPFIETMLVEVDSKIVPYGIRGVGEPPIVPVPAAVANAIHSATGVRIKELPMTPEVVLGKMKSREKL
jgi:xanthine dehydrogenase molybdenum-binding subunit